VKRKAKLSVESVVARHKYAIECSNLETDLGSNSGYREDKYEL
jgi:hypothetical protein